MQEQTNTKSSLNSTTRLPQHDGADDDEDTHRLSTSPISFHDAQLSFLSNDEESIGFDNMEEEMKLEKERYPGASSWAPAEERLFEILFMRQDLPMLPTTWDVDLRGVPISDVVFKTTDEFPPIIYAHSKDFRGKFHPNTKVHTYTTLTVHSNDGSYSPHGPHRKVKDKHTEWPSKQSITANQARDRQVCKLGIAGRRLPASPHRTQPLD